MRIYSRKELVWKEDKLYVKGESGGYLAKVLPDENHPGMYRYKTKAFWDDGLSDMFNYTRAKDNAAEEVLYAFNTVKKGARKPVHAFK